MRNLATTILSLVALSLGIGPATAAGEETTPPARPNIFFAIADDWGWPHAGAYGDPVVRTPTFDRVAREGILFHHAYVSSPSCTPSRAAILTGQWHWRLDESANLWSTLQARFEVYPDLLEAAGYFVGHFRKAWGPGRLEPGGRTRNPAGPTFRGVVEFLERRPEGKPFCFWFGSSDPHRPYRRGSGAASGMDPTRIRLPACFPDVPEVREDIADYYFEVQRFDREVREALAELERRGELENTIVVITGDHGMPFPRCKGNLYDTGARVPLAVRWGARMKASRADQPGRTSDDLVSLTDLGPTFLEAAGLDRPSAMTGRSLMPILLAAGSGRIDPTRTHVLTGKERHVPCQEAPDSGGTPMRAIRTHDYLYIRNFEPDRWPAGTPNWERAFIPGCWYGDVDNGPTKTYMVERRDDPAVKRFHDLAFAKRPAEELYDLRADPGQLLNVAADPAHAAARADLAARLLAELRATGDPRVLGGAERFDRYPYYGHGPRHPEFEKRRKAKEGEGR